MSLARRREKGGATKFENNSCPYKGVGVAVPVATTTKIAKATGVFPLSYWSILPPRAPFEHVSFSRLRARRRARNTTRAVFSAGWDPREQKNAGKITASVFVVFERCSLISIRCATSSCPLDVFTAMNIIESTHLYLWWLLFVNVK